MVLNISGQARIIHIIVLVKPAVENTKNPTY